MQSTSTLATRLQGEAISAPLSSMRDLAPGRRWPHGAIKLDARSAPEDVKVLQGVEAARGQPQQAQLTDVYEPLFGLSRTQQWLYGILR